MPSFMVAIKVEDASAAVASMKAAAQIEPAIEVALWPATEEDSAPRTCFVVAIAETESAAAAAELSERTIGNGGVASDSRPVVPGSQHDAGTGKPHETEGASPA